MNNKEYPVILIPEKIIDAIANYYKSDEQISDYLGIEKPTEPINRMLVELIPLFEHFPHEEIPIIKKRIVFQWQIFIGLLIISIFVGGWIYTITNNYLATLICVIFTFLITYYIYGRDDNIVHIKKPKDQYLAELKNYNTLLANYPAKFEDEQKKYKNDILKYNKTIEIHRSEINNKLYLAEISPLRKVKRNVNSINRGKSEITFLEKLITKFGDQVKVDQIIENMNNSFIPDFVIICQETGVHIDVEIDEPYSLPEKKPIHYSDSEDDLRDSFFNSINWVVVRFSEKQIYLQAQQCILLIEKLLYCIRHHQEFFFNDVSLSHKGWTYEESLVMVKNNARNNYC